MLLYMYSTYKAPTQTKGKEKRHTKQINKFHITYRYSEQESNIKLIIDFEFETYLSRRLEIRSIGLLGKVRM